ASAASLGARAYAVGQHIAFRAGEYQPQSRQGLWLLAHELTHIIQQAGGKSRLIRRQPLDAGPAGPQTAAPAAGASELAAPAHPDWVVLKPPPVVKQGGLTCWAAALSSWLGARGNPTHFFDIISRYLTTSC